ncbi:prepilin peptidase [Actinospica robiniae]|uniref:prepilin peptidase n=1 Tax=Actinospica robiniae TaxID=304901 RepID=UPI000428ED95|nr:prepilin peptidase [Actinospica robiniae]
MASLISTVFQILAFGVFLAGTASLAVIDARTMRLPNRVLYPVTATSFGLLAAAAAIGGGWARLGIALGAATVLVLVFGLLHRLTSLGCGDVRLVGLLGLVLGWVGPGVVVTGLLLGVLLAAVVATCLLVTRRMGRGEMLAYGPFLIGGAWLALLLQAT